MALTEHIACYTGCWRPQVCTRSAQLHEDCPLSSVVKPPPRTLSKHRCVSTHAEVPVFIIFLTRQPQIGPDSVALVKFMALKEDGSLLDAFSSLTGLLSISGRLHVKGAQKVSRSVTIENVSLHTLKMILH